MLRLELLRLRTVLLSEELSKEERRELEEARRDFLGFNSDLVNLENIPFRLSVFVDNELF